jgi:hypothetical protein
VLDAAHAVVAPGVTTDEIDRVVSSGQGSGQEIFTSNGGGADSGG